MLDAYIIDQIRREEAMREERRPRLYIEIPVERPRLPDREADPEEDREPIVISIVDPPPTDEDAA
ncbi:MAG: hypothetical protein HYV07_09870 [Deltaproteobacteria bacterium]|nr:hypothetical protein [Deltaproteobacteria bacterium]